MKQLYKYALVRFMPFAETGEFANIGVLLCAPESGYWEFKLAPKRFARITAFFTEMESSLYALAISNIKQEMLITQGVAQEYRAKGMMSFFNEITRTREGIVQFGNVRTLISDTKPKVQLEKLYEHYVQRSFATEQYREQQLVTLIKQKLVKGKVPVDYREKVFKVNFREIKIPLAASVKNQNRLIRPLAFYHEKATRMFEHGEQWANRISALIENGNINPDEVLFPVEVAQGLRGDRAEAYEAVLKVFSEQGFKTVDYKDDQLIVDFASGDED